MYGQFLWSKNHPKSSVTSLDGGGGGADCVGSQVASASLGLSWLHGLVVI